ncbi:MAG: hydroxyquinol 1,2-dioxygenase [Hyphomicrobiales bacterium]|nr:hydroxyquinol 1,2-dioxygenase [Hyphomicrobiales bacterium]
MEHSKDAVADRLTAEVVAKVAHAPSPRVRETLQALVRHLHAFVRDVQPTESEWAAAIDFLTRTGQICTDRRQEFILLSDTLGVSMLVDQINHGRGGATTETTVLGPFYVASPPDIPAGGDIAKGLPGEALFVEGVVSSEGGAPLADAVVDVWQSDDQGRYDLQFDDPSVFFLRGRLRTDDKGRFSFWSIMPQSYPIPTDGPVGALLASAGRHAYRPAHVHFRIAAPGHHDLVTHVFVRGDKYLDSDVVFGVKESLIADFERRDRTVPLAGAPIDRPHRYLRYDFAVARAAGDALAAG